MKFRVQTVFYHNGSSKRYDNFKGLKNYFPFTALPAAQNISANSWENPCKLFI